MKVGILGKQLGWFSIVFTGILFFSPMTATKIWAEELILIADSFEYQPPGKSAPGWMNTSIQLDSLEHKVITGGAAGTNQAYELIDILGESDEPDRSITKSFAQTSGKIYISFYGKTD